MCFEKLIFNPFLYFGFLRKFEKWTRLKLIFKFMPFWVAWVKLAWLMKESCHMNWHDLLLHGYQVSRQSDRSHHTFRYPKWVTSFWLAWLILDQNQPSLFPYRLLFSITKNKELTCSKIYTDFYTCRIEPEEQFLLLTQVCLKPKIL
jgi:hypothetical protein